MSPSGARVRVSGLVQGVGYRYFCYQNAHRLGLKGWVKNMPDGSVEVRVEGDRSEIEALIDQLKTGPPSGSVSGLDCQWQEYTGTFERFDVSY